MAIAAAVYLARKHHDKKEIADFITQTFEYDLTRPIHTLHNEHIWNCTCQGTVPQSIVCFLQSDNFETAILSAISLGGDSDTMAAMAGAIAEVYYGAVPKKILDFCLPKLDEHALLVCKEFSVCTADYPKYKL